MYKFSIIFFIVLISCNKNEINIDDIDADLKSSSSINSRIMAEENLPIRVSNFFKWGINGHNLTSPDYSWDETGDVTISMLKKLQLDSYRFGLNLADDGDFLYQSAENRWNILKPKLRNENINIVATFQLKTLNPYLSDNELFNAGYLKGNSFTDSHGIGIKHFMLGNEMDKKDFNPEPGPDNVWKILIPYGEDNPNGEGVSTGQGNLEIDYDRTLLNKIAHYLKGMIAGIRGNNPKAKFSTSASGWMHWHYFQLLIDEGVDIDNLGWQWYSDGIDMEDPYVIANNGLNCLDELGAINPQKDIWITEIGRKYGSSNIESVPSSAGELDQADWIKSFIKGLDQRDRVKAFHVYELFDQPYLSDGEGWDSPNPGESHYGLIKWNTLWTDYEYKPAYFEYKFLIEETKFGFEDYVYEFYEKVNLREPNPSTNELEYWTNQLEYYRNLDDVLDFLTPLTVHDKLVTKHFQSLLNRDPNQAGLNYWEGQLNNGIPWEELISGIISSTEFYNNANNNKSRFIRSMFTKLLNRNPTNSERNNILSQLNNGISRYAIAQQVVQSVEYDEIFVEEMFETLLDRSSDEDGFNYWVNQMNNEVSQKQVFRYFLTGKEFWNNAIKNGYEQRTGYSFYE